MACVFNVICSDAFASSAFKYLSSLEIEFAEFVHEPGWLNGLSKLSALKLLYAITNISAGFLRPLHQTIDLFFYNSPDVFDDLNVFFGSLKFPQLKKVTVFVMVPINVARILTAHNLNGLINVRHLMLNGCSIVSIETGAFDVVGRKLEYLSLDNNNLKQLQFSSFLIVFENSVANKHINLRHNRYLECNDDFYKIRNISTIHKTWMAIDSGMHTNCTDPDISKPRGTSKGVQLITCKRFFQRNCFYNFYAYPTIEFKLMSHASEDIVRVKGQEIENYKLIIFNHNYGRSRWKRCNPEEWVKTNVRCLILTNKISEITVSEYVAKSRLTSFIVMLRIQPLSIWPMNYHTVYRAEEVELHWSQCLMLILMCSGVGFAIGFLLCTGKRFLRHNSNDVKME